MNRSAKLPKTFAIQSGRVVRAAPAPRTEAPVDPEKDPNAAEPGKCAKCGAELPAGAAFCPKCGAKVEGDPPADPPPPDEKAAAAFATFGLQVTSARNLQAARGTIEAWKDQAGRANALATELADKTSRLATIERERLLEHAVAEGRLEPAEAWSFTVDNKGNKVRSFSKWAGPPDGAGAGQSFEQLASFVAGRPSARPAARPLTPTTRKAQAAASAPPGMKSEIYAAASRQVAELLGEES